MSKARKNSLRRMMPGVHGPKAPHADAAGRKGNRPKPKKNAAKVKHEVVAARLIAKFYRLKDDRVASVLGKFGPDRLAILGFLMKYGVEPPTSLLRQCTAQMANKVADMSALTSSGENGNA